MLATNSTGCMIACWGEQVREKSLRMLSGPSALLGDCGTAVADRLSARQPSFISVISA